MKKLLKYFSLICLLIPIATKAFTPLPAEQAFKLAAQFTSNNTLQLSWQIAPGYHLYRDRFDFQLLNAAPVQLAPVALPAGIPKEDTILGKYQVYQNTITVPLILMNLVPGHYNLQVNYQGCADSGFCYPPVNKQITLTITPANSQAQISDLQQQPALVLAKIPPVAPSVAHTPQDAASHLLAKHNGLLIFVGFLGFGLLLAFTPCVLPLLPILSGIIIGQGYKRTTQRSFYLSLTYALGIALTYAVAGAIAALAGSYVQAFFQNPWVIGLFSGLFVLLSLSLFGFYELRLPARWNHYFTELSNRQQGGTYLGVFIMGCLSVLIVSPCVTAPLIGTLTYLSSTGDVLLGSMALFAMGLGMGIPLIIAGTFEGKWLPKSGEWLVRIKILFGVLLLALAIYLVQRIVPAPLILALWAVFWIILAVYLGALNRTRLQGWRNFGRGVGVILLLYGSVLLVGALQGNTNLWQPLGSNNRQPVMTQEKLNFVTVKSVQDLQQILASAQQQHKPVLVDFYADWCVSCQMIERFVLGDLRVQQALRDFVLVRVDVTANDAQDKALQQFLKVIAPPTLVFLGADGREATRMVGEVSAEQFLRQRSSF